MFEIGLCDLPLLIEFTLPRLSPMGCFLSGPSEV